jgi:predicted AlkP superfamily pyrophosphatase or phosphodiesterase
VEERFRPTLSLVYLPHLDYNLQRIGPIDSRITTDLRELDAVCGDLIDSYQAAGAEVIVLSEYGIVPVNRPVHLNRVLRQAGMIAVREELGHELLDAGASAAFAVADHQIAHVYVNDRSRLDEVRALIAATPGVAELLDEEGKRERHLDHPRSGDFVALAEPDAWFTYYFWLDDERAPDYARTVDIHRKPGFDPVELFIDPEIKVPQAKVGLTLLKKQLGFRYLMEVVPLDASLVRGSHGLPTSPGAGPLFMTQRRDLLASQAIDATDVCGLILRHLQAESP